MQKRLYRTEGPDAKLFGVCGGIAEYFSIDPTLVRVGWALLTLTGLNVLVYIICALIMPKKSDICPPV